MKLKTRLAVIVATMGLGTLPALPSAPPAATREVPRSTRRAREKPSKAKAYGELCQGESKQHVAGTPGTPFSVCVSGAKKLLKAQPGV